MVGSYYYLATKGDWAYTSVYENMYNRAKRQLLEQQGFDMDRVEAMQEYVDQLED